MTEDQNTEPATSSKTPDVADAHTSPQKLDDVLIAMDIVDTLRHREQLVLRELDTDSREQELIQRLKEIYAAQGIDVSDDTLRDGVKALEENRFVYTPPKKTWKTKLAKIYVKRDKWLKPVRNGLLALLIGSGVWHFGVSAPHKQKLQAQQIELTQTLPEELTKLRDNIQATATQDKVTTQAEAYYQDGITAIADADLNAAKAALNALTTLKSDLDVEYTVRIVSRPGEYSGLFRIPDDAPQRPNYYLIVEAIDGADRVITVPISSIESQKAKRVSIWGVRVPKAVFDKVSADKKDDSIIQFSEIGSKSKGQITPDYTIDTLDGAIFDW
ncbi:DUF6384 family protein [Hirschia litorea]|uniref:DUF6384 family protein n=1 Tax=Hirschia litorea TaxID=1199156 RepID=A0ABW2IGF0_9PROT